MTLFKLPDLGEGLPNAEIHQWYVKVGESVKMDQPLVAMETAKALVDIPCPEDGVITALFGESGSLIQTGAPLMEFTPLHSSSKGQVVGHLQESTRIADDHFLIKPVTDSPRIKATPQTRLFAKQSGIALHAVDATGEFGLVTKEDIQRALLLKQKPLPDGFEPLQGVRRMMCSNMVSSHQSVVPVTVFDEVLLHTNTEKRDITLLVIRALIKACQAEPSLNTWFDSKAMARKCFQSVHLGLAMDNNDGLFVPVFHEVEALSDTVLRHEINETKHAVMNRSLPSERLQGATILLSNFGKFAGRFATPIVVPPTVAILAVGRLNNHTLPLSLSFDHRAVTGGEATRFLGVIINELHQQTNIELPTYTENLNVT